jgi:hypothetical protein
MWQAPTSNLRQRSTFMNRSTLIGISILLASCAAQPVAVASGSTTPGGDPIQQGISVTGTGEATGVPDTVTVDLGVSVLRPTVAGATAGAAALAESLIGELTQGGVVKEDITTTNYSVYPEYDYQNDTQTLRGYRVTNTVRAKIRALDRAGELIDAAVAAGGNDVVVQGVGFLIEDDKALLVAAREAAWTDAQAKAEQLAALAGRSLGQVVSISETVGAEPPVVFERALAGGDATTPIEPGTQRVTVTVMVVFAFAG